MSWTHYLLQVNIYLVVFYGFYKLLLDKETYFKLNRIYLVSAGVLSLAIPFLRFEWFTRQTAVQPVYTGVDQITAFVTEAIVPETTDTLTLTDYLVMVYLLGVLLFFLRFAVQLFSVHQLLNKANTGKAFSFFKKKMIDNALPQHQVIHQHEEVHIRQLHTLDVLFFALMGIINWFNPIIYLYKNTVKSIHEYLADEEAVKFHGDKTTYSLLLLSSAFGVQPHSLTNSFFNQSLIKKRIYMLHKQRSRKTAILKYGLFLPLFAITLVMSSATIRNNDKLKQIADEMPLEKPLLLVKEAVNEAIIQTAQAALSSKGPVVVKELKITTATQTAGSKSTLGADWTDFYNFLKKNLGYPAAAQQANLQGNSQVKFSIQNGEIQGLGMVSKALGMGLDAEAMRAVLAYENFKSIPDGKYTLSIAFLLSGATSPILNQSPAPLNGYKVLDKITIVGYVKTVAVDPTNDIRVYEFTSLETQPSFPGGMRKFYDYLKEAIKYPQEAKEKNLQGRVFLSFIVEKDGSLNNIQVERKLGSGTDEEALRVLKESPKWTPGKKNGNPVRVKYNIPISFGMPASGMGNNNGSIILRNPTGGPIPLYIIDGERIDAAKFATIKPEDIESINVLKNESATTLYGPEGKNGVIQIITKAGKAKKVSENNKTAEPKKVN